MLVRAKEWVAKTFTPSSRPTPDTIRRWILAGELNGKIINGTCFIEEDAPFVSLPVKEKPEKKIKPDNAMDELVRLGLVKPKVFYNGKPL